MCTKLCLFIHSYFSSLLIENECNYAPNIVELSKAVHPRKDHLGRSWSLQCPALLLYSLHSNSCYNYSTLSWATCFYITRHEGAKRPRASEIKSMLSSLVYYNWLIVTNAQKKRRSFAVRNSPKFRTFRR